MPKTARGRRPRQSCRSGRGRPGGSVIGSRAWPTCSDRRRTPTVLGRPPHITSGAAVVIVPSCAFGPCAWPSWTHQRRTRSIPARSFAQAFLARARLRATSARRPGRRPPAHAALRRPGRCAAAAIHARRQVRGDRAAHAQRTQFVYRARAAAFRSQGGARLFRLAWPAETDSCQATRTSRSGQHAGLTTVPHGRARRRLRSPFGLPPPPPTSVMVSSRHASCEYSLAIKCPRKP